MLNQECLAWGISAIDCALLLTWTRKCFLSIFVMSLPMTSFVPRHSYPWLMGRTVANLEAGCHAHYFKAFFKRFLVFLLLNIIDVQSEIVLPGFSWKKSGTSYRGCRFQLLYLILSIFSSIFLYECFCRFFLFFCRAGGGWGLSFDSMWKF